MEGLRSGRLVRLERASIVGKLACDSTFNSVTYAKEAEALEGRGAIGRHKRLGEEDVLQASQEEKEE